MVAGPVFKDTFGGLAYGLLLLLLVGTTLACNQKNLDTKANTADLVGDGKADDSAALQKLLQRGGKITIPKGTYRISSTVIVNPEVLEVSAEGATFVAAPRSTYILFSVQAPNKRLIWRGGTFDGNKDQQVYPGHPNPVYEGKWQQNVTNNGLIGNKNFAAEYVLIEGVTLRNFVSDGSCIRADLAEFRNCQAFDSAVPRDRYPQAFKFRSDGIPLQQKRNFRVGNCQAERVYIGLGVAAKEVGLQTYLEVDNFYSRQTGKSSIHLEHIAHADIRRINCTADGTVHSSRIFVGNQNREFRLSDFQLEGGFIRGAKNSELMEITDGQISNTQAFDYAIRQGGKAANAVVKNVIVEACKGGIKASQVRSCIVRDAQGAAFADVVTLESSRAERAAVGALDCKVIRQTVFRESTKGVHQIKGKQQVTDCQFEGCFQPVLVEDRAQVLTVRNSSFADRGAKANDVDAAATVTIRDNKFVQSDGGTGKQRASRNALATKSKAVRIVAADQAPISIEGNDITGLPKPFAVPQISERELKKENTIRP